MITEALTRPVGPLAAWQWGLVVVGGYVGYRVITGKSIVGGGGGGGSSGTTTDLSQTGSNIVQGPQGEPGPIGPPGPAGPPGKPATPPTIKSIWGAGIPSWLKARDPSGSKTAAVFRHYKLGYGQKIDWADILALFKKARLGYGKVVEPKDIEALFKKAGLTPPALPKPTTPAVTATVAAAPQPLANTISTASTPVTSLSAPNTTQGNTSNNPIGTTVQVA